MLILMPLPSFWWLIFCSKSWNQESVPSKFVLLFQDCVIIWGPLISVGVWGSDFAFLFFSFTHWTFFLPAPERLVVGSFTGNPGWEAIPSPPPPSPKPAPHSYVGKHLDTKVIVIIVTVRSWGETSCIQQQGIDWMCYSLFLWNRVLWSWKCSPKGPLYIEKRSVLWSTGAISECGTDLGPLLSHILGFWSWGWLVGAAGH